MDTPKFFIPTFGFFLATLIVFVARAESPERLQEQREAYLARMAPDDAESAASDAFARPPTTQPATSDTELDALFERLALDEVIAEFFADPEVERARVLERLKQPKSVSEQGHDTIMLTRLDNIRRPEQVRLSLAQCVESTLANSYRIRSESFTPGIATAQLVEAEAQFDATFFSSTTYDKQDRPSASPQLTGTAVDVRTFRSGIRKLLATGGQVSAAYALTRNESNQFFQTLNPAWFNNFVVDFRQPLARGFGLDVNRTQIELRRIDVDTGKLTFRQEVRDTIREVEEAFWNLVQARRTVTINARVIRDTERLADILESRGDFDVIGADLGQTMAQLAELRARFVEIVNAVRAAQDRLRMRMNDPDLPLASRDIEIIPIDAVEAGVHVVRHPIAALRARFMNRAARLQAELKALKKSTRGQQADAEQRLMALTDEWETLFAQYRKDLHAIELSEVMTALDHREELESSRLLVDRAKLLLGAAKNQALPRFDLITRYNTSGLGSNSDRAFDQLIEYDFEDWFVGVEFELPLGNRAARAAKRRWRAEVSKAMAAVQDGIEGISAQVLFNTGALETNLVKIESLVEGLRANQVRVEATVARAENRGPGQVDMELRAYIAVASSGEGLLNALVDYNMALIDLERAKGTLLEYNSVILAD